MNVLDILDVKITVWDAELLQFPSYFVRNDKPVLTNRATARSDCVQQNRRLYLKRLDFSRHFFRRPLPENKYGIGDDWNPIRKTLLSYIKSTIMRLSLEAR